MIDIQIIDAPL